MRHLRPIVLASVVVLLAASGNLAMAVAPDHAISPATASRPATLAASIPAGQWLQFKRDLAHTGLSSGERGAITADTLAQRWSRQIADPGSRAAGGPVIANIARSD